MLLVLSAGASVVTSLARSEPSLGQQTIILGPIGVVVAVLIALIARRMAQAPASRHLDPARIGAWTLPLTLFLAMLVSLGIVAFAFNAFPNSADEYGFLFQADTFLHGRITNPPPPDSALFAQNYLIDKNGAWVSQYLPGWPAMLALVEASGLPAWTAAALAGSLLLLFLWDCLRLECPAPGLSAALIAAYASSGFFLLNGATYFSHCASAAAVMAAVAALLRAERDDSRRWPAAAGLCAGAALMCRIDSGALAVIACLAAWAESGFRLRLLIWGLVGLLPMAGLLGFYDYAVTGDPFTPPAVWGGTIQFGSGGLTGVEDWAGQARIPVQTAWRLGELADTASLLLPALYVVALAMRFRSGRPRFYDILPIANFGLFLIFPDLGGYQMGPRYWFDGFAVLQLSVGASLSRSGSDMRRFAIAGCLLLIPVSLARLPGQVGYYAHVIRERSAVYRLADGLPRGGKTVILIQDFPSAWNDRFNATQLHLAKDFARNGIDADGPVLYLRGDVDDALGRACRLYPDAAMLSFHLDQDHPEGELEPLSCPR